MNENIKKIDGIDISVESIEYTKKRFSTSKRCNFYAGNINDWISKDSNQESPYSIVFSHLVLQFFTQDSLLEIFRGIKEKIFVKDLLFLIVTVKHQSILGWLPNPFTIRASRVYIDLIIIMVL